MSTYAIEARNLNKYYKKTHAIKDFSIQLNKNNIIGLIGANGSGKTTLLKICAGFLQHTDGEIEVLSKDYLTNIKYKEQIIYSMHDMPVADNEKLSEIIQNYQFAYPSFDQVFATKLMELFDLKQRRAFKSLSEGNKSLFHFICTLSTRCKVTLLDEPFIGIDIVKRKLAYEILLRDFMENPRTIILSSHNLSELDGILSEMILINSGKLVFYKEMDEVREMLFRAEGSSNMIQEYAKKNNLIYYHEAVINSFGIFEGSANSEEARKAKELGLTITNVTPEDVCVYVTSIGKERDLECLWKA